MPATTELSESTRFFRENKISNAELDARLLEITGGKSLESYITGNIIPSVDPGTIISGRVALITGNNILVDIGNRLDGVLPYEEEGHSNKELDVGDVTHFLVVDVSETGVRLSRKNVDVMLRKQEVLQEVSVGSRITVILTEQQPNGWRCHYDCVEGFLPQDKSFFPTKTQKAGEELVVDIESIDNGKLLLSRKAFEVEIRKQNKQSFFKSLNIGDIVEGVVRNLTEFGAFIQVSSGVIGLCHSSDFGTEELSVNQKVRCKIIKLEKDKNRLSLGIRQISEPSWEEMVSKYHVDDKLKAKVKSIVPYGAFIEVAPGVSGLVHVSDLSWSEHIRHPKEVVEEGQEVEVVVLAIDMDKQRLSLGMKQITKDPWDGISDRYIIGSSIEGRVTNKTKFGIFIEIEKGVEGLAHHTVESKDLSIGDTVKCAVTRLDVLKKKITLALES